MDWLKNNHPVVIISTVYCLGFAIFLYASFSIFISYDAFWHLKMGQDLLNNGLSPRIDNYSFTFPSEQVSSVPYFFQIVLSLFVSAFELEWGLQLLKLFAFSLFMLGIYYFYREIEAPWQVIAITLPYIFIFLLFRFNHVRPEIFDSSLVIVAFILYLKASKSFTHRNLAYIAILQLFWVNYHAPILGYVIFFGLFLDKAIDLIRDKDDSITWNRWIFWGLSLFSIGFLNPDLEHHIFSVMKFSNEWAFLTELTPTNEYSPNNPFFYVFWLVSAYIAVTLVMYRQYGLALVCCIFAFQSWRSINIITLSGIVVTALLAFSLAQVNFLKLSRTIKPRIRMLIIALAAVTAVAGVLQAIPRAIDVRNKDNATDFPHDVTQYLKEKHPDGGNIFNRLRDGGYLLYHLSPEFKVYIDGRTNILYPLEFVKNYSPIYHSEKFASISGEVSRYNIDFAIYPLERAWFPLTDATHSMFPEFVGKEFVLLSTRENNFPLSTRIMFFPMCWREADSHALAVELDRARKILPADSALLPLLHTLVAINSSTNPDELFNNVRVSEIISHYHMRLLAYIALELGSHERAFEFFQSLRRNDSLDLLMLAYAAISSQKYYQAEDILRVVVSEDWANLTDRNLSVHEQAIGVSLLEILKQHQPLTQETRLQVEQMRQSLSVRHPELELPLNDVLPKGNCQAIFSAEKISSS